MEKKMVALLMCLLALPLFAQQKDVLVLNAPDSSVNATIMQALRWRGSARDFSSKPLSLAHLSNLLWAGNGVNRQVEGKRTAPSAMNAQDVDIYAFLPDGVYLYDPVRHVLKRVVTGDQRAAFIADSTLPSAVFLLVSDLSRFSRGDDAQKHNWAAIDAGMVGQNMLLYSAAAGFASRPRVSMDRELLGRLLSLRESQIPVLNIVIGHSD